MTLVSLSSYLIEMLNFFERAMRLELTTDQNGKQGPEFFGYSHKC
jgi:hypothetical protein